MLSASPVGVRRRDLGFGDMRNSKEKTPGRPVFLVVKTSHHSILKFVLAEGKAIWYG